MATNSQPFGKIDIRELIYLQDTLKLSGYAQLVLLELLCGRHQNMIGFYKVDFMHAVIAKHLQLDTSDVQQAFAELQEKDLIAYDPESEVVLIKAKFRHSGLQNKSMATKACYVLSNVPDNSLFEVFASMLAEIIQHHKNTERKTGRKYKEETGAPSDWYKTLYSALIENGFIEDDTHSVLHSVPQGDGHKKKYMDMDMKKDMDMQKERGSKGENQIYDMPQYNFNVQELNTAIFSLFAPKAFSHEDMKAIAEKACEHASMRGMDKTLDMLKELLADKIIQPNKILNAINTELEGIPEPI